MENTSFIDASGNTSWQYTGSPSWISGNNYLIKSKATDIATNTESVGVGETFSYDDVAPSSL